MSINTIERILWDLHTYPEKVEHFHSNSDDFLMSYPLESNEMANMKSLNVRAMADQGVSQMLLFCSWQAINGGAASVPEYMRRMNTPA